MARAGVQERRAAQLVDLVDAAERTIAMHGLDGLRARDLAAETGIAVGAIYNLVGDMDELVYRVASRTMARLDRTLETAAASADTPLGSLVEIAVAYLGFATTDKRLWRALFEHRIPADKQPPDWTTAEQLRLFRHIVAPLAQLMPHADRDSLGLTARTLFSAVHGVVILGLDGKRIAVPIDRLEAQLRKLVSLACQGYASENAEWPSGPAR